MVTNTNIKRQRVMGYFLDAASEIALKSGISSITARNVADLAGYNATTIYNYFDGLDQLIAFSVIRGLSGYIKDLISSYNDSDAVEAYIKLWDSFCRYSFALPDLFLYAYASDEATRNSIQSNIEKYYEVFPDKEIDVNDSHTQELFRAKTFREFDHMCCTRVAKASGLSEEQAAELNDFGMALWTGYAHQAIYLKDKTPDEYRASFMKYYTPFLHSITDKG